MEILFLMVLFIMFGLLTRWENSEKIKFRGKEIEILQDRWQKKKDRRNYGLKKKATSFNG